MSEISPEDEDEAGKSAREEALRRVASRSFVRVVELTNFGRQPDELSDDQLQELLLCDDVSEYERRPVPLTSWRGLLFY